MLLNWLDELDALAGAFPEHAAQLDARIYRGALALLSHLAGRSINRVLERERDGAELGFPSPDAPQSAQRDWKDPAAVNRVLARVLYDLAPALGSFPAGSAAHDLISALTGDSPTCLAEPKRKRGQRNYRRLRTQARLRLVLATYYEAGRKGKTVTDVRGDMFPEQPIGDDAWKDMAKAIPKARRDAVRALGKDRSQATPDAARAANDLEHCMAELKNWLSREGPLNRDLRPLRR